MKVPKKFRTGVQRSRPREYSLEFNHCAHVSFLYVYEQGSPEEEEELLEMMERLYEVLLDSPSEINL